MQPVAPHSLAVTVLGPTHFCSASFPALSALVLPAAPSHPPLSTHPARDGISRCLCPLLLSSCHSQKQLNVRKAAFVRGLKPDVQSVVAAAVLRAVDRQLPHRQDSGEAQDGRNW